MTKRATLRLLIASQPAAASPEKYSGDPQRGPPAPARRRRRKPRPPLQIQSTPQLEQVLDGVCELWGMTDRRAVLEILVEQQLKSGLFAITGITQGPKLIVDNTKPEGHEGKK